MPLDVQDTLGRSCSMSGSLGAAAFICLETLANGGATQEEREVTSDLSHRCFAALRDDDCDVLIEVLRRRVSDPG